MDGSWVRMAFRVHDAAGVAAPCVADPVEVLERVPVAAAETMVGRRRRRGDGAETEGERRRRLMRRRQREAEAEAELDEAYQVDSFCARISAPTPRFFSFLVRPWCSATTVLKVVCSRWDSQPRAPHIARQRSLLDAWVQQLCARASRAPRAHRGVRGVSRGVRGVKGVRGARGRHGHSTHLLHSLARAPSSERSVAWSKVEITTSQGMGWSPRAARPKPR